MRRIAGSGGDGVARWLPGPVGAANVRRTPVHPPRATARSMPKPEDTPLMQQWRDAKSRHPDALVFFRVGDFYEMFYEDAEEGARLLGLTLTSRNNGAAAGV